MKPIMLLLGLLLALWGCEGGGTPASDGSAPGGGWETAALLPSPGPANPALHGEGSAALPYDLGAAPRIYQGQVGTLGNSFYRLTTGPGVWMASLSGLEREGALFVYPEGDFGAAALCSAASFLASTEACAVECSAPACSYGVRVYAFDDGGTPFLLRIE